MTVRLQAVAQKRRMPVHFTNFLAQQRAAHPHPLTRGAGPPPIGAVAVPVAKLQS
jgi:hypothetical protein